MWAEGRDPGVPHPVPHPTENLWPRPPEPGLGVGPGGAEDEDDDSSFGVLLGLSLPTASGECRGGEHPPPPPTQVFGKGRVLGKPRHRGGDVGVAREGHAQGGARRGPRHPGGGRVQGGRHPGVQRGDPDIVAGDPAVQEGTQVSGRGLPRVGWIQGGCGWDLGERRNFGGWTHTHNDDTQTQASGGRGAVGLQPLRGAP